MLIDNMRCIFASRFLQCSLHVLCIYCKIDENTFVLPSLFFRYFFPFAHRFHCWCFRHFRADLFVCFITVARWSFRHFVWYQNASKRTTFIDLLERKAYFYLNHGAKLVVSAFISQRTNFSITLS